MAQGSVERNRVGQPINTSTWMGGEEGEERMTTALRSTARQGKGADQGRRMTEEEEGAAMLNAGSLKARVRRASSHFESSSGDRRQLNPGQSRAEGRGKKCGVLGSFL